MPYRRIMRAFRTIGIQPIGIRIHWKRAVMSQYVKQFIEQTQPGQRSYILGFSYGAMIALIATARRLRPERLVLCSLSPYFAELLTADTRALERSLGKRRAEDFAKIRFKQIVAHVKAPTDILVGAEESRSTINLAHKTRRALPSSRLLVVKNAIHDLNDKNYLEAVVRRIKAVKKRKS
jgi:pimeloyl-ACP methyl ester carboxylesterase